MDATTWAKQRTYDARGFSAASLARSKHASVSVVLPARDVAGTIGSIVDDVVALRQRGVVDEVVVIDGASTDETRAIAAERGATVYAEDALVPELGPVLGKGDAMWRSLSVVSGEIVAFVDADTDNFGPHFVLGLVGPLIENREIALVKGAYRRPFRLGDELLPDGGGRVTELLARPWLNLHVPELAGFVQPLAGEVAARRSLLEAVSFPVGYGVEIGILLDALRIAGLDALAQVDLGSRQNHHQSLRDLSAMAYAVLVAAEARAGSGVRGWGRMVLPGPGGPEERNVAIAERPPFATLERPAV